MKIVFLSNFFNHHQAPLSDALWRMTDGKFSFVETSPMPQERKALGYPVLQKPYVISLENHRAMILTQIREADVVIAGSAPEWLIRQRIKTGKLLFRYSERPLRKGIEPLKYLPRLLRWHWRNPYGRTIYLLCASAYTAGDYARFGLFRGRCFRWGYFPETKQYDVQTLLSSKNPSQILWCGRFLPWKHPEDALLAAGKLKEKGYSFRLTYLGTGEMEEKLHQMAKAYRLEDCIQFLGPKTPEQVRCAMEKAGIFLFTSDRQEGWGAVLNEAMNSGCAVIAAHQAGAVPFLVRDGENGLCYSSGDTQLLSRKIACLLEHPQEQQRLGKAACETITNLWNAEIAADRLLQLTEAILAGEMPPELFAEGPCSRAEEIREDTP